MGLRGWILANLVALFAISSTANAQPQIVFNASGSSGIWAELGGIAYEVVSAASAGSGCVWTQPSGSFKLTDNSPQGMGLQETGPEWVVWSTGTGPTANCSNPSSDAIIYAYLQTDSVVGVRCLLNGCTITTTATPTTPTDNLLFPPGGPVVEQATLPSSVLQMVGGAGGAPALVTAAGTDIRPEDALFATQRAIIPCGATTDGTTSIAPYLGLGYQDGNPIGSFYNASNFYHVVTFSLPLGGMNVTPFGAAPVIVAINHASSDSKGFGDINIKNLNSGVLANFLSGTYSQTRDAVTTPGDTSISGPVTVLIREPLSGAYNNVEYNGPNSLGNRTSQDVGMKQMAAQVNCSGTAPASLTMNIPTIGTGVASGFRNRVLSTQEAVDILTGGISVPPPDGLAYALWSDPTFARTYQPSTSHARYVTIDGVDPLEDHYGPIGSMPAGTIPTRSNGLLANVTLSNVQDGSYPIWSLLRLVDIGAAPGLPALVAEAQNFVSFGSPTAKPDFIPLSSSTFPALNLGVLRSHFAPPGQILTPSNGTSFVPEAGGDVGGIVYTILGDEAYCVDFAIGTGQTGDRR